jgi:hypothetical protein
MKTMPFGQRSHSALLTLGLVLTAACASTAEVSEEDLRAGERKIVGVAYPYAADTSLAAQLSDLEKSKKLRREVAWKAIGKILKPVTVRDDAAKTDGKVVTLPLFRTWYGKDDFGRVFAKAYGDLSDADRKAQRALTVDEVQRAYAWNAVSAGSWNDQDYLARIKLISDVPSEQGLGGNSRVSYSPGYTTHLLKNYASVTGCMTKLDGFGLKAEPASATNFAGPCMPEEFPPDAAMLKASWWRSDFGTKLPLHMTDAESLKQR